MVEPEVKEVIPKYEELLELEKGNSARHDVAVINVAKDQLLSVVFLLLGFLQQLSLIQVEGIKFELWGTVFAFLRSLSLNFNLDFAEEYLEVFLLCFALAFPVFLLLATTNLHFRIEYENGLIYPVFFETKDIIFVLATLVSVAIGSLLIFLAEEQVAAMPFFAFGSFTSLLYLYKLTKYYYFKRVTSNWINEFDEKYENYKDREMKALILLWATIFGYVVTIWLEVGVLNNDLTIKIIFSILGSIVAFYMIVFVGVVARLATTTKDYRRLQIILQKFYFFSSFYFKTTEATLQQDIIGQVNNKTPTFHFVEQLKYSGDVIEYFKASSYFFFLVLLLEKFLLIFVQIIMVEEFNVDPEFLGVIDLCIVSFMFTLVLCFQPYSEFILNAADLTGRLSNLMLLGSATLLTFLDSENENSKLVFGLNIFMLMVSILTGLFWFYVLIKAGLVNFLLSFPKKLVSESKTKIRARDISNCTSIAAVSKLLTTYDVNQAVSLPVWKKLSFYNKLKTMLVERTCEMPIFTEENKSKHRELCLQQNVMDEEDMLRIYGFDYYMKNELFDTLVVKLLDFTKNNEKYLTFLVKSKLVQQCQTLTELRLDNTRTTLKSFVKLLKSLPNLKRFLAADCFLIYEIEAEKEIEEIEAVKELSTVFHKLDELSILGFFMSSAVSPELLKVLSKCFFERLELSTGLFDDEVIELLYKLVEDRLFFKSFPNVGVLNVDKTLRRRFVNLINFKRLEEPELKFENDTSMDKERAVMRRKGEIVGFSRETWVHARDGVNAHVLVTLKLFNKEEDKLRIKEIINHRWEDVWIKKTHGDVGETEEELMQFSEVNKKTNLQVNLTGETLLELVLLNGISFVAETVEALLEAGADISLELADGSKTLKALILENEDENVSGLLV